ncbi:hypothetical protein CVT25_015657 [Psilocybe cyanescens]|uniref:Uncharacterized protein n=1 Tax=Psilocybe cyanescens TaxID=93625 RepID=A0A409WHZ9_PSICY|nr:hypothetical protein CVT25_015657 [Psilocybe cyanescens]
MAAVSSVKVISMDIYDTYLAVATNIMLLVPSFDQITQSGTGSQVILTQQLALSWEALITYDSFIFGLLLWKIFGERQTRFPVIGVNRLPLRDLLIRDASVARLSIQPIMQHLHYHDVSAYAQLTRMEQGWYIV